MENSKPISGTITEFHGKQPEIPFANMIALEKADYLVVTHITTVQEQKPKTIKVYGTPLFQYGWPTHERSRTYTISGKLLHMNEISNQSITEEKVKGIYSKPNQTYRIKIFVVILFIINAIIAISTNIASDNLPSTIRPYLWLSWPTLIALVIIVIILMLKQ